MENIMDVWEFWIGFITLYGFFIVFCMNEFTFQLPIRAASAAMCVVVSLITWLRLTDLIQTTVQPTHEIWALGILLCLTLISVITPAYAQYTKRLKQKV